jgi:tRNA(Ile)-lysidine synthase TilS/MesJ
LSIVREWDLWITKNNQKVAEIVKNITNMPKSNKEQQIKIGFTKKQFEVLLKLVYLGNWMANANRNGTLKDPMKKEYEEIENYIFSFTKQFGFDEYVDDADAEKGEFYPTRKFEEETDVHQLHEEYDEATFWDEIVDRLGDRDFFRHYSKKEIRKMSRDERFKKLYEFIDKWADETGKYGIERLEIKKDD